jgi:hypothetical protein
MKGILPKHALFVAAAVISPVWAWAKGVAWVTEGGNLINLPSFFIDAYNSGSASTCLTIYILFVWGVFLVWVIADARRIGLGTRTGAAFGLLSMLGICFAFPLYLVRRERWLDRERGMTSEQ